MTALQIFPCLPLIFFTYSNVRNFTFVFNNKLHKLSFFIHIFSTVLCKSPYSVWIQDNIMSAIRQTGKSQNGCYKKTKRTKFSRKEHLPSDTHTYVCVTAGKKCSFFGKFGVVEIRPLDSLQAVKVLLVVGHFQNILKIYIVP